MMPTSKFASLQVPLQTSPEQTERLRLLQVEFAQACNALAPMVQSTACWNRVALHHMAYRMLRQRFPDLGSQMVCNAVYAVSRTCRTVFQDPASPLNLARLAGRPLPLLRFSADMPVYFDRHTLSVKNGLASMFTLDGRMRFQLHLRTEDEERFRTERLREIVLLRSSSTFMLSFHFGADADDSTAAPRVSRSRKAPEPAPLSPLPALAGPLPSYVDIVREPQLGHMPPSAGGGSFLPATPLS